jgi:hypothetical protein
MIIHKIQPHSKKKRASGSEIRIKNMIEQFIFRLNYFLF